ncbi:MAG: dihydrofolate reductase [Clostridium sp.]
MFRDETMGKVIVMGRKTLESLPGARPLYGRTNIVLTTDPDYRVKGASACGGVEEVMELLRAYHTDDVYIIGGESVYRQFLPYCDEAQITWIDFAYAADTHFPNLTRMRPGKWFRKAMSRHILTLLRISAAKK